MLPARLACVRIRIGLLFQKFVNRCMKNVMTTRLQRGFDEVFSKQAESPTWQALCRQVFGQYLGQLSFTPVTQIHLLAEKLHVTSQSRVLELAPGTGGLSVYLAKLTGCHLVGVDASPIAVKIANRRAMQQGLAERVHFEVGILPQLLYPDSSFDVVISIDSVYGVPEKISLFRGCYRVLRPGGYLGFYTLYRRRKIYAESPMHGRAYFWFPSQSYSILLEQAGYQGILKMDLTEDFIRLAKRWLKAIRENRASLEKELGIKRTKGLLMGDIAIALSLASEGCIGRALYKAQKPLCWEERNMPSG